MPTCRRPCSSSGSPRDDACSPTTSPGCGPDRTPSVGSGKDDGFRVEVVVESQRRAVVVDDPLKELLVHRVLLVTDQRVDIGGLHVKKVLVAASALGVDRRAEPDRVDAADLGRPRPHHALHVRPVLVAEVLGKAEEHDVLKHQGSPRSVIRSASSTGSTWSRLAVMSLVGISASDRKVSVRCTPSICQTCSRSSRRRWPWSRTGTRASMSSEPVMTVTSSTSGSWCSAAITGPCSAPCIALTAR